MAERRRRSRLAAALAAGSLLAACAAGPPPAPDPAVPMREAQAELEHASPAARDALDEGLRWIVLDAPGTNAVRRDPVAPARAELPADDVDEPAPPLPPVAPTAPAAVAQLGPSPTRPESTSYVTLGRLNLRQGPGHDQTILAVLPPGTEVIGLDVSGKWLRVATPTRGEGWVSGAWLAEHLGSEDPAGTEGPGASGPSASRGAER